MDLFDGLAAFYNATGMHARVQLMAQINFNFPIIFDCQRFVIDNCVTGRETNYSVKVSRFQSMLSLKAPLTGF